MFATLTAYTVILLVVLAAVGLALLPLALLSGWWAHRSAGRHQAAAERIAHLLGR